MSLRINAFEIDGVGVDIITSIEFVEEINSITEFTESPVTEFIRFKPGDVVIRHELLTSGHEKVDPAICRAKPRSGKKDRATTRGEAEPPEREDERKQRKSDTRGANTRTTLRGLGKDRRPGSERESETSEEGSREEEQHERKTKEHPCKEAPFGALCAMTVVLLK